MKFKTENTNDEPETSCDQPPRHPLFKEILGPARTGRNASWLKFDLVYHKDLKSFQSMNTLRLALNADELVVSASRSLSVLCQRQKASGMMYANLLDA